MNFKDKTVIVTGASNGIGKAIALAFGEQGANVVVNYLSNKAHADAVVKEITALGGQAVALYCDVSSFEETARLVEASVAQFGQIDVLVNNTGITKDQLMLRMTEDDFDAVIDVNLRGSWNMTKHVCRAMLKQKSGRIINMSSVVGLIGNAGQVNYVASKSGLIGMTKSLAKEFGKKGVTVNAVAPGFIQTRMTESLPEAVKKTYLSQIPLNRFGTPKDVSDAVLFLASDAASYITGQVISVNGGMI